jgi:hypothetical protein
MPVNAPPQEAGVPVVLQDSPLGDLRVILTLLESAASDS